MKKICLMLVVIFLSLYDSEAQKIRNAFTYKWDSSTSDWVLTQKGQMITSADPKAIYYKDTTYNGDQKAVIIQNIYYRSSPNELDVDSIKYELKNPSTSPLISTVYASYKNDTLQQYSTYFEQAGIIPRSLSSLQVFTFYPGGNTTLSYRVSNGDLTREDSTVTKTNASNLPVEQFTYRWIDSSKTWRKSQSALTIFTGNFAKESLFLSYYPNGTINYEFSDSISITYNSQQQEVENKRYKKLTGSTSWQLVEIRTTTNTSDGPVLTLIENWEGNTYNKTKIIYTYEPLTNVLAKNQLLTLTFAPNPVSDVIHLTLQDKTNEVQNMRIVNMQGVVVQEEPTFAGHAMDISVQNLPKGIYMLEVQTNTVAQKLKFVKN